MSVPLLGFATVAGMAAAGEAAGDGDGTTDGDADTAGEAAGLAAGDSAGLGLAPEAVVGAAAGFVAAAAAGLVVAAGGADWHATLNSKATARNQADGRARCISCTPEVSSFLISKLRRTTPGLVPSPLWGAMSFGILG